MVPGEGVHHSQIMRGVLDMCVLASIVRQPSYGYALVEALQAQGLPAGSEGSMYPVLKRLHRHGLIEAELEPSGAGPARKVYHVTGAGRSVLQVWIDDWRAVSDGVDTVLAGIDAGGDTS